MSTASCALALALFMMGLISECRHCEDMNFDEAMSVGVRATRMGDYAAAFPCFQRAILLKENNAGALLYFGETCLKTGRIAEAIRNMAAAQKLQPTHVTGWLLLASAKHKAGDYAGAVQAYNAALRLDDKNVAALVNGGTVLKDMGQAAAALTKFQRAVEVAPHVPEASYNLGDVLLSMDRHEEAYAAADAAQRLSPTFTAAHILKILSLEAQQRFDEAVRAAERGISLVPADFGLMYEHARMLRSAGRLKEAEAAFKKCTSKHVKTRTQNWRPSTIAYAHNEYAHLLSQTGRHAEAKAQWKLSIEVDPSFAQGWVNAASHEDGIEASLAMYSRAVALSPGLAEAWINIGQVYYNNFRKEPGHMRKALDAFERARAAAPASSSAEYSLARTRVDLCHWQDWQGMFDRIADLMQQDLSRSTLLTSSISLVYLLVYPIPDPLLHAAYAARAALARRTAAGLHWRRPAAAAAAGGAGSGPVVVVGYLSPDLKEHPVGLLFQRVPALHAKGRFRVVLFPLLRAGGGDRVWAQLEATADEVVDLTSLPAAAAAEAIAARRVDVLVDMAGYTQHGRPELLAAGAAGVVVSMMGFAASLRGAGPAALLCDPVACPPETAPADLTEAAVYLPGTFYLADHPHSWHTRRLAAPGAVPAVRKPQVAGLRAGSFVFASFNQAFKVDPEVFAAWMRALRRVPDSQIWIALLNEGAQAEPALRAEARRLGIREDWRLVFTGSADLYDHVAYKSAADLMLDTRLYNAHSTAADTLFAGVPVLTLPGRRMVSRVGASIARAAGAAHGGLFIARDLEDYEELAVRLARCAPCLARARRRLVEGRGTCPLYDAEGWVRAWERGLTMLLDLPPAARPAAGGGGPDGDGGAARTTMHIVVADRPPPEYARPAAAA